MTPIPQIIHQVWSGKYGPIPQKFAEFAETWKTHHPDWEYKLWNEDAINRLIKEKFPQYKRQFDNIPFDIQRWDVIRYLILFAYGGLYADLDYQCLKPFHDILDKQTCCMGMEPESHSPMANRPLCIGNALMACTPGHSFFRKLIQAVFTQNFEYDGNLDFLKWIIATTGPVIVTDIYLTYPDKNSCLLLCDTLVAPFSKLETAEMMKNPSLEKWRYRLENAMAIHYFAGTWLE